MAKRQNSHSSSRNASIPTKALLLLLGMVACLLISAPSSHCGPAAAPAPLPGAGNATALVQAIYANFVTFNIAGVAQYLSDNATLTWTSTSTAYNSVVPWAGSYTGKAGFISWATKLAKAYNTSALVFTNFIASGPQVVVLYTDSGTSLTTGKNVTASQNAHYWLLDSTLSTVLAFRDYQDTAAFVEAYTPNR